jgi:hypothetical protein
MNSLEERARRNMVHDALELLLSAKPMTRAELFVGAPANTRPFQRRVIDNLVEQGVVSKQNDGGDPNSPTISIKLKDRRRLEKILEDEVELTRVIWPGSVPPALPSDRPPPEDVTVVLEEPTAPPSVTHPDAPLPAPVFPIAAPAMNQEQLMERLLLVMDAACQSIIYTREKVDRLEKTVEEIKKQVNFIYEGLTK